VRRGGPTAGALAAASPAGGWRGRVRRDKAAAAAADCLPIVYRHTCMYPCVHPPCDCLPIVYRHTCVHTRVYPCVYPPCDCLPIVHPCPARSVQQRQRGGARGQRRRRRRLQQHRGAALQVAFERQTLKPVFHLIGFRLWA
jgi:hypothetical protein